MNKHRGTDFREFLEEEIRSNPDLALSYIKEQESYIRKLEVVAELAKKKTCCTPSHEMFLALRELEKK